MKTHLKYTIVALAALLVVSLIVCGGLSIPAQAASSYYVDCSAGTNGDGSSGSPWNNLASVNATTFSAGDSILLKRGTTCHGQLHPLGSGTSGSPITLGAYGSGALPIVDGDYAVGPVLQLYDQEYWEIENLEVKESTASVLVISGSGAADLNYFRLTNLHVHHGCLSNDCGGKGILVGMYQLQSVNDLVIENCTVHDAFKGIITNGDCCNDSGIRSTDVTVRNSTTYDIENDGIFLASANNMLVEYNVAYRTGLQTVSDSHSPNAIWTWDADGVVAQFNEAYLNESPFEADGGAFDIDYFTDNSIYQYNYGHDNENMCIAIYGGDRADTTTNNVFRYNVCANNSRQSDLFVNRAGEIRFGVWSGGNIADSYVYNNTVYWNPANTAYYAFMVANTYHGKSIKNTNIYNNIVYATAPKLVGAMDYEDETTLDYNLYWYTGAGDPEWLWGNDTYTSLSAWQTGSGQDANAIYADPKLNGVGYHGIGMPTTEYTLQSDSPAIDAGANLVTLGLQTSMGGQDFYGNGIPDASGLYDIGAHEYGGAPAPTDTPVPTVTPGGSTVTPIPPTDTPGPPTDTPVPTNTPTGGGGQIFFDGFEDGDMSDWTQGGGLSQIRTDRVYEGTYSVGGKKFATWERTISTAGYANIHLKYAGQTSNLDAGESFKVEWYDGSSWTVVDEMVSDDVWTTRDWTLSSGAADNPYFAVRFTANSDGNTEWSFVDNVEVTSE